MKITSSTSRYSGTTFYKITEDQFESVLRDKDANLFIQEAFKMYGFSGINIDTLWGSIVENGYLYLCETDGQEITVGEGLVDPEEAIENFGIDMCSSYIQDASDEVVANHIFEYELSDDVDLEDIGIQLLSSGYSIQNVFSNAYDLNLVDL